MTIIRRISASPNLSSGGVSTSSADRGGPPAYGPRKCDTAPGAPKSVAGRCTELGARSSYTGCHSCRMARFDFEELFGEDYLYFYADPLPDELNDADVEAIVTTLGLQPGDSVLDAPCGHGRISNRLARRGLNVVGVDAAKLFLE